MEPYNFLGEEIHNVRFIMTFVASNEVCHLGEPVYCNDDSILPPKGPLEGHDEVHTNVIPRL